MRIALIGFGTVGQGLVRILHERAETLEQQQGFKPHVVAVVTRSRGTLVRPAGLALDRLLAVENGTLQDYPDEDGLQRSGDTQQIARAQVADVLVEATPTDMATGQPALSLCLTALEHGQHVVLANKGPLVHGYHALQTAAAAAGRQLRFEATVMAGTPALHLGTLPLAGAGVRSVRGILNGTTNYMLTEMGRGLTYDEALAQAQAQGIAETDPEGDVGGWDAAAKLIILSAALFDRPLTMDDIDVNGIKHVTRQTAQNAIHARERLKLIASLTPDGGRVQLERLPLSDPLSTVEGTLNAITYHTDLIGDVTLTGPGAGQRETAFALLADLLALHRLGAS